MQGTETMTFVRCSAVGGICMQSVAHNADINFSLKRRDTLLDAHKDHNNQTPSSLL